MDQLNYSELVNKTFVVFNMKKEHALLVITSQIQKPRNTLNMVQQVLEYLHLFPGKTNTLDNYTMFQVMYIID